MQTTNFRKHPYRGIFSHVADELSAERDKPISAASIRQAYRRGSPEIVRLVTEKLESRLLIKQQHSATMQAISRAVC